MTFPPRAATTFARMMLRIPRFLLIMGRTPKERTEGYVSVSVKMKLVVSDTASIALVAAMRSVSVVELIVKLWTLTPKYSAF